MAGPFDQGGINRTGSSPSVTPQHYDSSPATGNAILFPNPQFTGTQGPATGGESYTLVEENNLIYLRRDSDGSLVEPGVPAGGGAEQIGFLPPSHDDHSGGENDGEIILGDSNGNIISALPVDVRANGTIVDGDNGLIGIDNGRVVFNVSTVVQEGDERPVTSGATKTYVDTQISNLPPGHDNIGGILSISSTPDKVAEIGIYDTDSARIGQQFVISTVDTINDIQDISINSEPASGASTEQLAQRLEITLNKATAITAGVLQVPTSQAVIDYVQSITTNPVTAAHVIALLQDDTGNGGIQWSIDSGTGNIIGVATSDSTKQDQITGNSGQISIPGAGPGGSALTFTGGGDHLEIFSGSTQVSDADTTGLSFTVGSGSAAGLTVADTGANVNVRIGIPTQGTVPTNWDNIATVENVLDLETVFSFTDADLGQELVGYVNLDLFDAITITNISGVATGSTWTVAGHATIPNSYYVISWGHSYAVLLANSTSTLLLQRYHLRSGDAAPIDDQPATLTVLENIQQQNLPNTNSTAINVEAATRAEDDATEVTDRIAGDAAERDYVEDVLHVDPADSQSYYQFADSPAIFAEDPAVDYGISIAMAGNISDTRALVQAEALPDGPVANSFKQILRYGDGANDTGEYIVTTHGSSFTLSNEIGSETFTLPTVPGCWSAASVHQNGTSTRRQDCFLAIGGWAGKFAQVDMAHVLDVSNGNILTGRALELGQDYSEHIIADNNNTTVTGLVFDNQTTGSHTGINAYVQQRRNPIVRYRASASGGLFSFRHNDSVVDRFNRSRVPNVVETQTVDEGNWFGLEMVTIQAPISATAANGDGNRLTYAVGDKMLVSYGEAISSSSAGILVPGIATTKNPSTFAGGNVNLGLFYTGGEDPSEEYSNYSSANEAAFNATINGFAYSQDSNGNWRFFFGGQSNGVTGIANEAAGFYGESIWNMATINDGTKAAIGGTIRSVATGGSVSGDTTFTFVWITANLGTVWSVRDPQSALSYSSVAKVQGHTNPHDPTSPFKTDFVFRGFQYYNADVSIGIGDDNYIYRNVVHPEVTISVGFGNVTHTATYTFDDDTADMHTHFGNPASYSPTLVGSGVTLLTTVPSGEDADQRYLTYSVNGQNTPTVALSWIGVLSAVDPDFDTYNPFRRIELANTIVDITYPDGGAVYHIPLSSNVNDYVAGAEAQGAVDQIAAAVNTHAAAGHTAVRVDGKFADAITGTTPVLRLDQTGTHALENAPVVVINHPSGMNTGDLSVMRFANGGFDTIGRPGGLFNPNNYDTRAETDAKIAAAIVSSSSGAGGTTVTANTGEGDTTYPALDTVQFGTEIFNVRRGLQTQLTAPQLEVVNGDAFNSASYRQAGDQDIIDAGKQDSLGSAALMVLAGDPFTAANYRTLTDQTAIDDGKIGFVNGFTGDNTLTRSTYGTGAVDGVWNWSGTVPTTWQDVIDNNNTMSFFYSGTSPTPGFSSALGTQGNPGQLFVQTGGTSWAIFTAYFSFASNNNVLQFATLVTSSGTPTASGALRLATTNLVHTSGNAPNIIFSDDFSQTSLGDAVLLGVPGSGGSTTVDYADITGVKPPADADRTTAALIDGLLEDNGGSRGASYSVVNNKVRTTIQPDNDKLDVTAVPATFRASISGTPGLGSTLVASDSAGSALAWKNASASTGISRWLTNTTYAAGDVVRVPYGDEQWTFFVCNISHTSDSASIIRGEPTWNDYNTHWIRGDMTSAPNWESGYDYNTGNLVTYVDTTTPTNSGVYQASPGGTGNNPATTTSWTRISGDPIDDVGVASIGFSSNEPSSTLIVPEFAPTSVTLLNGTVGLVSNLPAPFTVTAGRSYSVTMATNFYTGTFIVPSTAVEFNSSGWFFDTDAAGASASPAVPTGIGVSTTGNTVSITEINPTGTEATVVGAVHFTGPGVTFNAGTDTFTFSGGGVSDAFRYSQLLTGGFLLAKNAGQTTATRRAYTDTAGAYGTADNVYYYEASSKSWFNVQSGGTALISFPTT